MEPQSMWETYIDPRFRSEAPRLREVGPHRTMTVEGEPLTAQYGKYPFASAEFLAALARGMQRFKQARLAGFDAESRLRDMDEGGVDVQILHPTVGAQLLGRELKNPELLAACCRAYNDWSAEYCGAAPQRLRWAAMLPFQNIDLAIEEAHRSAEAGAVAFYLRPNPIEGRNLYHKDHLRLWAEIETLAKPICIHDSGSPRVPSFGDRLDTHTTGHIVAHPFEAMAAMMSLIWYGVLERFPKLRIVHVEADAGWLPYWLQRMEQHWDFSGNAEHPDLTMRPTEYFKRNFFVGCRGDETTLRSVVELTGDENILFNTDYPHPDGTWPWGMHRLEGQAIPDESKRKIFWDNAARVFGLAE
jgi:predicted TIM-barrel fold metal-dependent hydrolase